MLDALKKVAFEGRSGTLLRYDYRGRKIELTNIMYTMLKFILGFFYFLGLVLSISTPFLTYFPKDT